MWTGLKTCPYVQAEQDMKVADLTVEEFEALIYRVIEEEIENLYLALDPSIRERIEEGLKDIREGRVISLDELMAQRKARRGEI